MHKGKLKIEIKLRCITIREIKKQRLAAYSTQQDKTEFIVMFSLNLLV